MPAGAQQPGKEVSQIVGVRAHCVERVVHVGRVGQMLLNGPESNILPDSAGTTGCWAQSAHMGHIQPGIIENDAR